MTEPFRIDDSRMPVILGSALKVPSYAYKNWGIPEGKYRQESDDLYSVEWKGGSPRQMQYVIEAITRTGLGNFSQMLRNKNSEVISHIIQQTKEKVNYLEPGAGISTVNLYQKLIGDGVDVERIFTSMIEPSEERLEDSAQKLEDLGLKRGQHFVTYGGKKDTDTLVLVGPETQDIIGTVAQIHHHSYLDVPMLTLSLALRPGGYLVTADWHNSMWEHPNRVYEYLKNEFEWETKKEDLAAFVKMFPLAIEPAPKLYGADEIANRMIRHFCKGWEKVKEEAIKRGEFDPRDDILMLEGHRPGKRYVETGERVGLYINTTGTCQLKDHDIMKTNPLPLIENSSILNVIAFQKESVVL